MVQVYRFRVLSFDFDTEVLDLVSYVLLDVQRCSFGALLLIFSLKLVFGVQSIDFAYNGVRISKFNVQVLV